MEPETQPQAEPELEQQPEPEPEPESPFKRLLEAYERGFHRG